MTQADSVHSTPPTNTPVAQTRRRFLSTAASVAAGGTVLALATMPPASAATAPAGLPDPVFGLIEAYRTVAAAYLVALEEQNALELIGDPSSDRVAEAPCHAAMEAFNDLIETAPTTFAGLRAWASYLDEIRKADEWMFEETAPTLVMVFVEALENLAGVS